MESALLSEAGPLPAGLCGVELHLLGTSHDGLPVTASAYFEARAPVTSQPITNPHLLEVVSLILEEGWSDDPDEVTEEELDRLIREARVPPILLDPTAGEGMAARGAQYTPVVFGLGEGFVIEEDRIRFPVPPDVAPTAGWLSLVPEDTAGAFFARIDDCADFLDCRAIRGACGTSTCDLRIYPEIDYGYDGPLTIPFEVQ